MTKDKSIVCRLPIANTLLACRSRSQHSTRQEHEPNVRAFSFSWSCPTLNSTGTRTGKESNRYKLESVDKDWFDFLPTLSVEHDYDKLIKRIGHLVRVPTDVEC